jgi:hypothetical protein
MSDDGVPSTEPYDPDLDPDTDATMTAPEGGRPDGAPPVTEGESLTPSEDDAPPHE